MAGASITQQHRGQVSQPGMDYEFSRYNTFPTVSVLGHGNQTSLHVVTVNSAGGGMAFDVWQLLSATTSVGIGSVTHGGGTGLTFFYDISCPAGIIFNAKAGPADITVVFRENQ